MALMLRPLRVCDRQKRKRLRNRCFATATDINRCSVARSIEVTMVGRYRLIDRDYQGQLSRRLRSRVLMHAYATRGLGFLVCCAIISRQLGQGRQLSGGSPLFMIGASLSEPHTSDTTYFRCVRLYIYIYIYLCVRRCPPKPPTHAHMLDLWF